MFCPYEILRPKGSQSLKLKVNAIHNISEQKLKSDIILIDYNSLKITSVINWKKILEMTIEMKKIKQLNLI